MKYIFMDVDATLTNDKKEISDNNIRALNLIKDKAEIIYCSGRCNKHLIDIAEYCHMGRYLISSNGSMIYDKEQDKVIDSSIIGYNKLLDMYNYAEDNELVISFNAAKYRYCNKRTNYSGNFKHKYMRKIDDINELRDEVITQVTIGSYQYDKMMLLEKYIACDKTLEIVNISTTLKQKKYDSPNGFFFDVVIRGVNKGYGIKRFMEIVHVDINDTIAIGDHINDLSSFDAAKYKIAMGNGCDELKKNADFITKDNNHDGVMHAINYILDNWL